MALLVLGCAAPSAPPRGAGLRGPADGPLAPTLEFRTARQVVAGGPESLPVAWQSGLPVPSFDPQDRPRLDLGGEWRKERFKADHNLTMQSRGGDGLARLEAEAAGRHLPNFDDAGWPTIRLPAVENRMPRSDSDPAGPESYEDGVWYRRSFTVPADWKGRLVTLNALAINYVADVWVNGQWVGYHEGGYTPFSLDLSGALEYGGENQIAIRVDNPPWGTRLDTIPGPKVDWWNYTGIIQEIGLEAHAPFRVVRADVKPLDLQGNLRVTAVLHNAGAGEARGELRLRVRKADPDSPGWLSDPRASAIAGQPVGEPVTVDLGSLQPDEAITARLTLPVPDPALWDLLTPNLYVLEAELVQGGKVLDRFATQFGIRTLRTERAHLLLNERSVFLRGLARHEEWPDTGRTAAWERIWPDFKLIMELGANFVRTGHYPNHPHTYIIMDRLGLGGWVEIPVWQFTDAEFMVQENRRAADQMWREMILAGANRPSVFFWSSNNESRFSRNRTEYVRRLTEDWQRHFDDGRLIAQSAAADRGGPADASMAYNHVPAWTLYFGIFHGSTYYEGTRKFLADAHKAWPEKPLFDTEFGIWSRGGGSSPSRQVEVFEETFRAFQEVVTVRPDGTVDPDGFLAGITWWCVFDWYTSHTKLQTMGLYSMDRFLDKPVARVLKAAYTQWQ
ncbi:MAG: glycoside hydrolase family 2 protein [Bacillota bacterium]